VHFRSAAAAVVANAEDDAFSRDRLLYTRKEKKRKRVTAAGKVAA